MNFIKFLGTAGSRFVTIRQLRSSGGIWLKINSTNILIDPGPGSIVRANSAEPKLDVCGLDAIILTHKHLDHSGDINVMIEAMTQGRLKKKGILFAPKDAIGRDGVVHSYLIDSLEKVVILDKGSFSVGDLSFEVPVLNQHSVLTYGLKFQLNGQVISFVSDTRYFDQLLDIYKDSNILILNVVFDQKKEEFEHLCLEEAFRMVKQIRPDKAIFTHFGMSILKLEPQILEKKIKTSLDNQVQFAYDGLMVEL